MSSACDKYTAASRVSFLPNDPQSELISSLTMASTRRVVLSLYRQLFRIARTWQAQSGMVADTGTERKYIVQEARTLFRQNQQMMDEASIKRCIEECEARIEIGLHYRNPYPRPTYLPPMGLATQKGKKLRAQQRLRKQAKPVYLHSHDET
ncbi:LYR motif containing protein 1 [Genypterus blacodes]|uniref:LYR motif containing protein 1 n=1 Tax=Genypterus blacodes TaxID=154954 RepID=UPI003F762F89